MFWDIDADNAVIYLTKEAAPEFRELALNEALAVFAATTGLDLAEFYSTLSTSEVYEELIRTLRRKRI